MKKNIIWIILMVLGIGLLAYPTISNTYNTYVQSKAIAVYQEAVDKLSVENYEEAFAKAKEYNVSLYQKEDRFTLDTVETKTYTSLLNPLGNGMMGRIEIPSIQVDLPIYHTVKDTVLQNGVGHIPGSSLPTGEKGSHVLLSGHNGLPSAELFTHISELREGDTFLLYVLNQKFTYQVDQIRIVLPYELNNLNLDMDKDYVTLITCTPYGVNSHRLLVRGHHIPNGLDTPDILMGARRTKPILVASILFGIGAIVLFVMAMLKKKKTTTP